MKRVFVGAALATTVTFGMVASAQIRDSRLRRRRRQRLRLRAQQPTAKAPEQQVTLVGCVTD